MSRPLKLEGGMADLGRWGGLVIVDRRHLAVVTKAARREEFDVPEDWAGPGVIGLGGWLFEDTGIVLAMGVTGTIVVVVALLVPEVVNEVVLERDPNRRFRVSAWSSSGDDALLLWERGLARFDSTGACRWTVMHEDGTAGFDTVTADAVWIKGQSGDARRDRRRGYRLADGSRLSDPEE